MNMSEDDYYRAKVLSWLEEMGGSITKAKLRNKRPQKLQFEPYKIALQSLLADGSIVESKDHSERLYRKGYTATRYTIAADAHP